MASTVTAQDGQTVGGLSNSTQKLIAVCRHALHEVYWKHPPWFLHRVPVKPEILFHSRAGPTFLASNVMMFAMMQKKKFSREIRDLICAWIWDDEEMEEHRGRMWSTIQSTCLMCVNPSALHCRFPMSLPYYLRAPLVGTEMARELVESWYTAAVTYEKNLLMVLQPTRVEEIICKDAFNVGIDPAQVLRKLEIDTRVSDFVPPEDGNAPSGRILRSRRGEIQSAEHRREVVTEPLLRIQQKEGFQLIIKVHQKYVRLNHWREVFDALREPVRVMKAEGAVVKVTFWYDKQEYGSTRVSYDIVDAILQPEEEWKPKAVAFLDAQPAIANIHRLYRDENKPDFDPESDIYLTQKEIIEQRERDIDISMYGTQRQEPHHDWQREYLSTGTLRHERGVCQCPECKPHAIWGNYNLNNDNEDSDEDEYSDD